MERESLPGDRKRRWIDCPLCDSPDTRAEPEGEDGWLIFCTNLACPSNVWPAPCAAAPEPSPTPDRTDLLRGATVTITVEDGGYIKAYAKPPIGIIEYGLQGRLREEVGNAVHQLVTEFLEANRAD